MKCISIDIESYSDVDLQKCGVYKYVQSPNFEILLFGYSVDEGAVKVVDLAQGEQIPDEILDALTDEQITKWAFNSQFERICLSEYLRRYYPQKFISYSIEEDTVGDYLSPGSWKCTRAYQWALQTHKDFHLCRYDENCSAGRWTRRSGERPCRSYSCCADGRDADSFLHLCR